MDKPYKGHIADWFKQEILDCPGLGYIIVGLFINHPDWPWERGHTSYVIKHDENTGEIETRNSRYTLIGKAIK